MYTLSRWNIGDESSPEFLYQVIKGGYKILGKLMEPSLSDFSECAWEDLAQDPIINILEHYLGSERRDVGDRISRAIILA